MRTQLLSCLLCSFLVISSPAQHQHQKLIDSLENCSKDAKSDWEKLDLAIGLHRLYTTSYRIEDADKQLEIIYSLKERIPSAEAYGLIMENIRAYFNEGNDDKAISKCLEAIEVSQKIKDANTLAYARYQLAENYIFEKGDTKKALDLMLLSLDEIDKSVSLKTIGNTHKTIGYVYGQMGEFDKGHYHLSEALRYFDQLVNQPPNHPKTGKPSAQNVGAEMHVSNTYNYIGDLYEKQGMSQNAIDAKLKGLSLMEAVNNIDLIAWLSTELGRLYINSGRLNEALQILQKARILFEELDVERDIKQCNTLLINILIDLKEYENAEEYLNENITYYLEKNDSVFLAGTYLQGVRLYLHSGQHDKASRLLNTAQSIAENMEMIENKAMIHRMQGKLALKHGEHLQAVSHFKSAIQLFLLQESKPDIARVKLEIAGAFHALLQFDSALVYVEDVVTIAETQKDLDLARDAYQLKSEIIAANGDYKNAFNFHKQFFKLHDSLYTINAQAKLKEEQVRQDVVSFRTEKELAEQNALLLKRQNKIYVGVGVVILTILILMAYLYLNLRKVKAKIQSQNQQLSQLNHTKDKFFGIIAHDLRSPLMGLQGVGDQVDYFLKKGNIDRLRQVSGSISDVTKRLNELLDNLLNWALLQNGMIPYQPEKVNVHDCVDAILHLLSPLAELKEVTLVNEVRSGSHVYADEKAVNTILRNLISNALKFTEKKGAVTISLEETDQQVRIIINDTGTGIAAEQLPRIFGLEKESKQGTMGEKGTGLGLILCKELVELNQGNIKVESQIGKGSTFIFDLPKAA